MSVTGTCRRPTDPVLMSLLKGQVDLIQSLTGKVNRLLEARVLVSFFLYLLARRLTAPRTSTQKAERALDVNLQTPPQTSWRARVQPPPRPLPRIPPRPAADTKNRTTTRTSPL